MAASRLKGITIPINGDVTPLTKALKDVNATIKSTTGYLKEIDAGLKLDPSNVELLTKKQGALNDAILATKEKLQTMQDAAEAAHDALARGEISEAQYRDLQAEIQATENSLASLQSEAEETSAALIDIGNGASDASSDVVDLGESAADMGSEFDLSGTVAGSAMMKVGEVITNVGEKLMNVTTKVKELATASIESFTTLDSGLDTIIKKTGASGENLEEMKDIAKKLYGSMPAEMDEIGAAVGEVATRFGVEGKELEDLSRSFLRFAELNGTDVSSSIDQVQKLMGAFGMETKQASNVLDLLNQTGQDTGINVMTLAQNMQSQALALQEMGLNAAEAAEFLGQVEMSGADVSTVMTSLRTAFKNSAKDGEDIKDVLISFSHYLQTGAKDTDKLNKAMELFGSKGGAQMMNAIKDGQITFEKFDQNLTDVAGNVDKTYNEVMKDGADDYTVAMHNMELAGAEVGETLLNDLVPVMEAVTALLKDFSEWWTENDETTHRIIEVIALVVSAIGPLLVVLGTLVTWIGSVVTTVSAIWPWITATAIPFITNTVVPTVASVGATIAELIPPILAVIAVITAVILWIKNFDDILEVAKMFIFDFKESFMYLSDWIGESGAFFLDPIFEAMANFQIMIEDLISGAFTWGKDLVGNLVAGVKSKIEDVKSAAGSVGQSIKDFLHFSKPDKGPLADIDTWMPDMMGLLTRGIEENLGTIQSAAGSAAGAIAGGGRDYSGQLSSIQASLAGAGAPSVTVYIGQDQLDAMVYDAIAKGNYIGGGR